MDIGVIREIKNNENRVALTPDGAASLVAAGHRVLVEHRAGENSGFADSAYAAVGCEIVDVEAAWSAELVLKVKEPQSTEYRFLDRQMVFTYFHLAGVAPELTTALLAAGTTAIAYETVQDARGNLPLLAPMSAIAGNMAVTVGSYFLARFNGGKGVQLGTVMAERHGKVVVLGDGVVGRHAARVAVAMGANTLIFTRHRDREQALKREISSQLQVAESTPANITRELQDADLLVGAVLLPGARAPHLVTEAMVAGMEPGSTIVDVSIDQGGCIATSRPTSHAEPVFTVHDVIHYCVTNMPGAYPRTSTIALTNATLDYVHRLAEDGIRALRNDSNFAAGVNTFRGYITDRPAAGALGLQDRFDDFANMV